YSFLSSPFSEAHDIVAAVHVDDFSGDAGAHVGGEEDGGAGDLVDFHVSLERGALGVRLQHVHEAGDAARGQGFHRAGGDGVDAYVVLAEIGGEIADGGFQRGLGHAHDVVARDDFFGAVVG